MRHIRLVPGETPLAAWRAIWRGARVSLDPAPSGAVAASAAAVRRIVARNEPVYGVNTGFGKLASVRIGADDLERLQLQHRPFPTPPGSGEPDLPRPSPG